MALSFIAKDYDALNNKVNDGSATVDEISQFVAYEVELQTEKARLQMEMDMQDSEIAAKIEEAKARAEKARLELELLRAEAVERLKNVE